MSPQMGLAVGPTLEVQNIDGNAKTQLDQSCMILCGGSDSGE